MCIYACFLFLEVVILSSESDNDDVDACANNAVDDESTNLPSTSTQVDVQATSITAANESNAENHEKLSGR